MMKLLLLMLCLVAVCATASAAECTSISKVDFANRTLSIAGIPKEADHVFHFHHGISFEYEGGNASKPDWRTTIRQDVLVKPQRSLTIRFLTLFRNHLSGSGSRTYLVGLACFGGRIQQVFQSSGIFMQAARISSKLVQISVPVWKASDPLCCPSARKELRYAWDPKTRRYVPVRLDRTNRSSED